MAQYCQIETLSIISSILEIQVLGSLRNQPEHSQWPLLGSRTARRPAHGMALPCRILRSCYVL